jgi:hypothetical protein
MRIKFNTDWTGCLDGIHPTAFRAGDEAEVPERIASTLVGDGRAFPAAEAKALAGSPEDKMAPVAPENKARRSRPRK